MSGKINVPLVGGLLAGIAASVCCVGSLILLLLGLGGAWVSYLTALEPYRPVFIAIAVIALSIAYLRIYRPKSGESCKKGKVCATLKVSRLYKRLFIGVVFVVIISITSPYLIPIIDR
ncbi:MAG: mercuric transport protein [Thiotrichales bacterium]|nr:mercuric transport protein [Thiotrichales bacterium]